ncbi:hypothetical protein H4S02_001030 [Coemansia sp. RSA 2611]|nr:hypothetical protein H4S02_001030 [Coemansia sp. RSA 2611]
MNGRGNVYDLRDLRRFEIDDSDDLEALQQEFFKSGSQPAARVARCSQAPHVAGSAQAKSGTDAAPPEPKPEVKRSSASGGDILDFAARMSAAIKEFEIKEKSTGPNAASNAPAIEPVVASAPKKLSLFAQRRLAKQKQAGGDAAPKQPDKSNTDSSSSAATFLPKLMAPIPEHESAEPAQPPQQKSRKSGFPEIPADYVAAKFSSSSSSSADMATEAAVPVDLRGTEKQADVHEQISQENEDRIKSMSKAEIIEAQSEIRSMVSNDTLQRLLRRKNKLSGSNSSPSPAPLKRSTQDDPPKQVRFAETKDTAAEDESDGMSDLPPPPPPAEWVSATEPSTIEGSSQHIDVDDNTTGADSEFYKEMKRRIYPSEMVEDAQLAWMMGHNQAKSPMEQAVSESRQKSARAAAAAAGAGTSSDSEEDLLARPVSRIRFAFDGHILGEEEADIPTNIGLHHHGEEPDKPGYTIPELLHLARSTVAAQRSVAMATLGNVVHKINTDTWDPAQSSEIYSGLLDWQAELYFAQGILEASKTGRVETTIALWTWVVEMSKYKTLIRLATGGELEMTESALPGPEIRMSPAPVTVKGVLIERTYTAFSSMLTTKFMNAVYECISLSLMPEQQLRMLAECIKTFAEMSEEFDARIKAHSKLPMQLQNKFPYLMNEV